MRGARAVPGAYLALLASLCVNASALAAQSLARNAPWVVTLTPTMNPLPIGSCGAVRLTLLDSTGKDAPRTPQGWRVSIADFDLSVSGDNPRAVAGNYDGASSYTVCACQSATVGSSATITARYPGKALAEKSRVPGATFETSAPFTIQTAMNANEPKGCNALAQAPVAVAAAPSAISPRSASQATLAPAPAGIAQAPVPMAAAPSAISPRSAASQATLAPAPAGIAPTLPAAAAAPVGVAVTGTPLVAHLTWSPTPNATRYAVWRGDGTAPSMERTPSNFTATQFTDTIPDPRVSYRYTVVAHYTDGTRGEAPAVSFTSPPLVNPAGFTVADRGQGNVEFHWQPVPGALQYRIDGTGLPNTGTTVDSTSATLTQVPGGPGSWKLVAIFPGNFADYDGPTTVSSVVHVLPPHTIAWLSKPNGVGGAPLATTHYIESCRVLMNHERSCEPALEYAFQHMPGMLDAASGLPRFEAVYANPGDFGFGRRTSCASAVLPPPAFLTTLCYSTSHGPGPGEQGFGDPAITTTAAMQDDQFRTATLIIKDATGMRFRTFVPSHLSYPRGGGYGGGPDYKPVQTITLDTEGAKFVPHTCLACHGGRYDAATRRVLGATLLPLDPSQLAFAGGPAGRAAQEESIRRINQIVLASSPNPVVASYIQGLYGGAVAQPGAKAVTDYVPVGWKEQTGLYKQIVKPYCATCHMAAQPSYSFASWSNFQDNAALIHIAVCLTHSMPHAEIPYKQFWTKDTGPVYMPGVLAAALGYPSC